jgi:serine/threonine-protein kinase
MLCGRAPFVAKSEFELMVAQVKEAPKPPGSFRAGVPRSLDAVVLKALEKDPARRYANCGEFAVALDAASVTREEPPVPEEGKRPSSRLLLYGAGPVFAIVLLVIWFLVRK